MHAMVYKRTLRLSDHSTPVEITTDKESESIRVEYIDHLDQPCGQWKKNEHLKVFFFLFPFASVPD